MRGFTVPSTAGVPEPETLILPGQRRTAVVDIGARDAPPIVLLHAVACTGLLTLVTRR
jgi:3-oxoadipate enol-lactonase